jgi:Flp pilus assembly protein TadD
MLASLYMRQQRLDEARLEFERMVKQDPAAPGPRTMVGMILESQGKRDEARRSYEATVAAVSDAPVAANNLAMMYAEDGTNLDVALQLATTAKQRLPDTPHVDDTLGWVYYKKNLPALAIPPLEACLQKLPNEPVVMYHLGLSYAKVGDKAKARDMLTRALSLNPRFDGHEVARQTLATVVQP